MMMNEDEVIKRRLGKWSSPDVPHKGWTCSHVVDHGEVDMVCEMCESISIRYEHIMVHPDYPGSPLGCGEICAGHMEQNYQVAHQRQHEAEKKARREAAHRKRAAERAKLVADERSRRASLTPRQRLEEDIEWRETRSEGWWTRIDDWKCVIFIKPAGYKFVVSRQDDSETHWSQRAFESEDEVKAAALDALARYMR